MTNSYHVPPGGLPPQTDLLTSRAMFTEAYAVIPKGVLSDIVTSFLPGWTGMRMWMLARPLSGFAETFSQYVMEVAPGGGSDSPDQETGADQEHLRIEQLRLALGADLRDQQVAAVALLLLLRAEVDDGVARSEANDSQLVVEHDRVELVVDLCVHHETDVVERVHDVPEVDHRA